MANYYNNDTAAIIHRVFPRKTFLRRKTAGQNVDYQMIAANIDIAYIVQSCHFDLNPRRLDRYLVMAADGHVEPVVILTKTDLISRDELDQKIAIIGTFTSGNVLYDLAVDGVGLAPFHETDPHVSQAIRDMLDQVRAGLIDGSIDPLGP